MCTTRERRGRRRERERRGTKNCKKEKVCQNGEIEAAVLSLPLSRRRRRSSCDKDVVSVHNGPDNVQQGRFPLNACQELTVGTVRILSGQAILSRFFGILSIYKLLCVCSIDIHPPRTHGGGGRVLEKQLKVSVLLWAAQMRMETHTWTSR